MSSAGKYNHYLPKKIEVKAKKHHGVMVLIFICGFIFPPLAVAIRFGIGTDFWINLFLCICGYFPCHIHNFYIQNIRNNSNKHRTPKWAVKHGLVDPTEGNRKKAKSQWAGRYEERNPHSALEDQELEGDQEETEAERERRLRGDYTHDGVGERARSEGLWNENEDTEYYNPDPYPDGEAPNQKHWSYPANFAGAAGPAGKKQRSGADRLGKSKKKPAPEWNEDVPEWGRDYGAPKRGNGNGSNSRHSTSSLASQPSFEDNYGRTRQLPSHTGGSNSARTTVPARSGGDGLDHQF